MRFPSSRSGRNVPPDGGWGPLLLLASPIFLFCKWCCPILHSQTSTINTPTFSCSRSIHFLLQISHPHTLNYDSHSNDTQVCLCSPELSSKLQTQYLQATVEYFHGPQTQLHSLPLFPLLSPTEELHFQLPGSVNDTVIVFKQLCVKPRASLWSNPKSDKAQTYVHFSPEIAPECSFPILTPPPMIQITKFIMLFDSKLPAFHPTY